MANRGKQSAILSGNKVLWAVLLVLTATLSLLLHSINMPAAFLIGSIAAGIVTAVFFGGGIKVPSVIFSAAQSVLGCMVASIFTASVLRSILDNIGIVLFCVISMLIFSFFLGWILTARKVLPGSTAIWGSWPGGASTMVILSGAYGADMRLVAFMQYMRVVMVALTASLVTMLFGLDTGVPKPDIFHYLFDAFNTKDLFFTLGLAAVCAAAAKVLRFSAGPILLSMISGAALMNIGVLNIALPHWLLVITYVLIGWSIGLRFTREIVLYALKALPAVFSSVIILMLLCAAVAAVLVFKTGIDPLTAYLAASPGGADSIVIIAASGNVDMAFVMSVQVMRFGAVLLIGPWLASFVTKRIKKREEKTGTQEQ